MNDNNRVFLECGNGWKKLIDPLVERCTELGGRIDQIKEKFGGLRFYYTPLGFGIHDEAAWDKFEDAVDLAELESKQTCEMCGKPGQMMTNSKGSWIKTLCADDALNLGYKQKA